MNSQIYCLPQKHGWNSMQCTSSVRAEKRDAEMKRALELTSKAPYFKVRYHGQPPSDETIARFRSHYPKFKNIPAVSEQAALNYMYNTEYSFKYGPRYMAPHRRPTPPITYEVTADPMLHKRQGKPSFQHIMGATSAVYDADRGAYFWRNLVPKPGMYIWQPLERIPILGNAGERSTILPARLPNHDPDNEKMKWDNIRNLVRNDAVSYVYRNDMVGYTGYRQNTPHVASCVEKIREKMNPSMVSYTHAYHRKFPTKEYCLLQDIPAGFAEPSSRIVSLANPQNPFTPGPACNNVESPE